MNWKLEIEYPVEHPVEYLDGVLPMPERAHLLDHVRPKHHVMDALAAMVSRPSPRYSAND